MRKNYSTPETESLEVMAHDIICASGGAAGDPGIEGQIGTLKVQSYDWDE